LINIRQKIAIIADSINTVGVEINRGSLQYPQSNVIPTQIMSKSKG